MLHKLCNIFLSLPLGGGGIPGGLPICGIGGGGANEGKPGGCCPYPTGADGGGGPPYPPGTPPPDGGAPGNA